jgi:hypothetical protein
VILQIGCGIGPFRGAVAGAVDCATEENFPELFRKFFLLHRARYAERGEPGVLANPKPEQFHLDAEQRETVDFLRSHEAYKYFWGAHDQPTYRRAFFRGEKN